MSAFDDFLPMPESFGTGSSLRGISRALNPIFFINP